MVLEKFQRKQNMDDERRRERTVKAHMNEQMQVT